MATSNLVWLPSGIATEHQQLLSVPPTSGRMIYGLYVDLLGVKLQQLIDADRQHAKAAMQMSVEHAPGLWAIQEHYSIRDWGSAIARSDQTSMVIDHFDWTGRLAKADNVSLLEILEFLG
jgi:hypothetical protein